MPVYTNYNDLLSAATVSGTTAGTSMTTDTISWSIGTGDVVQFQSSPAVAMIDGPPPERPETEKEWLRRRVNEMLWSARN